MLSALWASQSPPKLAILLAHNILDQRLTDTPKTWQPVKLKSSGTNEKQMGAR
jgi:hypothetical protein